MAKGNKIKLPVVVFDKKNEDGSPWKPPKFRGRNDFPEAPVKEQKGPAIIDKRTQDTLLDCDYIGTLGIREYTAKEKWKQDSVKWTVLFDNVNHKEIVIALSMDELVKKLTAHNIINILN